MRTLRTSPEPETRALTSADRCDRCSARALVRALLPAGELLFCGHHARAHEQRLVEIGATLTVAQAL
jgi:hypothetical protein